MGIPQADFDEIHHSFLSFIKSRKSEYTSDWPILIEDYVVMFAKKFYSSFLLIIEKK
jgi:hypothetical protein